MGKKQLGFTIVELLIVIVVIGILAGITIVAYNGIQNRAKVASIQSDLKTATKALSDYRYRNTSELYPSQLSDVRLPGTNTTYVYNSTDNSYCLTKVDGAISYYVSDFQQTPTEGTCGNDSLVSWWKFNGNADDSVGSNNGTVINATLSTGQNGQTNGSYSFNGTDATINFGNSTSLNQKQLTMSIWARPTTANQTGILLAKEGQYKYRLIPSGLGVLIATNGTSWSNMPTTNTVITANSWQHIVLTIDSDRLNLKIYLNGVLMMLTSSLSSPITNFNTKNFYVGSTQGTSEWFNGNLDDARVYSRVLSAAEIKGLYDAGAQ